MFSTENQPTHQQRLKKTCRAGHPLEQSDSNVRVRTDGRRICRACESARNASRYAERHQAIPSDGWTVKKLSYNTERYDKTSVRILQQFINWLKQTLVEARAKPQGTKVGRLSREEAIKHLEGHIPMLDKFMTQKAVRQIAEESLKELKQSN